jgi:diguanylate cyclase (GGDEF)-like protein
VRAPLGTIASVHPTASFLTICRRFLTGLLAAAVPLAATAAATPGAARWSQHTELSFQHLTQAQGLPNEIAKAVAQDGDGFLWIGTLGGLARWDGYRMRVYAPDPQAEGALPDNVVQVLHRDAAGRLWVGTSAAGLVRHDPDSDRFVRVPVGAGGLAHVSVKSIADDGAGGLWVATDGGLDRVEAGGTVQRDGAAGGLPPGPVHVLLRDRAGALWAGTPAGLYRRAAGARAFELVPLAADVAAEPLALAEDRAGRLWVGTQRHGVFVLEPREGGGARPVPGLAQLQVNTIVEARDGELWFGTASQGIVAHEPASGLQRHISNRVALPVSLADNTLHHLFRDRAGLVWAATNRGISRHDPRQSAVLTWYGPIVREGGREDGRRIEAEVSWILPMPDGRVWLATHKRGVDIVDPSGALAGALRPDPARPQSALPQDTVLALERANDGRVLVATKRGLYRASADGRRVERLAVGARDVQASTWAMKVDGDTVWLGGQHDGLWRLDLASGRAEAQPGTAALSDQRITVIAKDGPNALWVGTRNGLNRLDLASGQVERLLPDTTRPRSLPAGFITTLHTDRRGRLWVGTYGGGIAVQAGPRAAGEFTRVAAAQGLPDDNVNAFVEGGDGAVWVSLDSGFARIDPETLAVRALKRAEGVVLPMYWTGSAARTDEGELLFGGSGGITVVRPTAVPPWTDRPPVVVSELAVGGVRVPPRRHQGETAPPVLVSPDANALSVEFAAIDYSAPERNRYAYKLEGYDADWTETDPSRRLAVYTNLPPGDYRLRLRGSNRDGAWNDEALTLPVRVLPAWWQTWWARGLALLLVAAALFAIVQQRTRSLRARQAELERKVRERTAELEALSRQLAQTAITDPLTGLHNRRFLTEHIDGELAAAARRAHDGAQGHAATDTDHVFLIIDVDRFKQVNDRHGHGAGDAVLVQFGQRLLAELRGSDHLVRWGGEEFLAVARETDRARADELAERLRAAVAAAPFVLDDGRRLAVTCSIGYACLPFAGPHASGGPGWQDIVRLADAALLAAKRAGRDAWVGLHAGPAWPPGARTLPERADVAAALRDGRLRVSSNLPPMVAEAALAPPAAEPPSVRETLPPYAARSTSAGLAD